MQPTNSDEFLARFNSNQEVSGFGLETAMHMPCPFCAAANFMIYKIIEVHEKLGEGATCAECGRSAKILQQRTDGAMHIEVVQTGGPDQPEWLTPKMRRVA